MVSHPPASPGGSVPLQNAPATTAGVINLQGQANPSFPPFPGKGLTADLLGCDFGDLSLTSSISSAIDRGLSSSMDQAVPASAPQASPGAPIGRQNSSTPKGPINYLPSQHPPEHQPTQHPPEHQPIAPTQSSREHQPVAQHSPEHQTAQNLPAQHHLTNPVSRPRSVEEEVGDILRRTTTADEQTVATSAKLMSTMSDLSPLEDMIESLGPTYPTSVIFDSLSGKINNKLSQNTSPSAPTSRKITSSSASTSNKNTPTNVPANSRSISAPAQARMASQSKAKTPAKSASAPKNIPYEALPNELRYKAIRGMGWFRFALSYSRATFRGDPDSEMATTLRKEPPPAGVPQDIGEFPQAGDIWIHTNTKKETQQVWQHVKGRWVGCTQSFGDDDGKTNHPIYKKHVLSTDRVLKQGTPSYITAAYHLKRSKEDKKAAHVSSAEGSGSEPETEGDSD